MLSNRIQKLRPSATLAINAKAIELKKQGAELVPEEYAARVGEIHQRLDELLAKDVIEPKNLRLARRMIKHREHLLTFLDYDAVDPTNNQAERQIRPFVLQRKISAGNRSEHGAWMHSVLSSVMATAYQQGLSFVQVVLGALQNPDACLIPMPRSP